MDPLGPELRKRLMAVRKNNCYKLNTVPRTCEGPRGCGGPCGVTVRMFLVRNDGCDGEQCVPTRGPTFAGKDDGESNREGD